MPPILYDPVDIFDRGLIDPDALTPEERLVYLVQDIEALSAMEGWDHFFKSDEIRFYEELKTGLRDVGDSDSLAVLEEYEQGLRKHGVSMDADAIGDFLAAQTDAYFVADRDWRDEFDHLTEQRWQRIADYLLGKGIRLLT